MLRDVPSDLSVWVSGKTKESRDFFSGEPGPQFPRSRSAGGCPYPEVADATTHGPPTTQFSFSLPDSKPECFAKLDS